MMSEEVESLRELFYCSHQNRRQKDYAVLRRGISKMLYKSLLSNNSSPGRLYGNEKNRYKIQPNIRK